MMSWIDNLTYNVFMFPFEKAVLHKFRKTSVAEAHGDVLEIGIGTGINTGYFNTGKLSSLTVLDTNIRNSAIVKLKRKIRNFKYSEGTAEQLPFDDSSFDTVVFTLVFCSVENPLKGLAEIKRVLKDDGKVIFIEHVKPMGNKVKKIADSINPCWNSFSNGCNLNRETLETIINSGFELHEGTYHRKGVFITGIASKTAI
jgi:ubiquinone/menaquinone biosynthesis C-methylase UbiE